ncbi:Uncharacterised protein [Enterococcus faecalis]|uniref:DUF2292 domain-containing protein n=1 Tax=Enterococcus faecalis TaxID=1351 RepID=A0AAX2KVB2_ENTFL|nr:Uncharacterised protein [Enterococcus faecalis]
MENREKIIQLFKNPLVTGYGIEIMSNGRLFQQTSKDIRIE